MANANVPQKRHVCRKSRQGQMEKELRLQLAIQAWEEGMGAVSYRKIAREFNIVAQLCKPEWLAGAH